MNEGMMIESKDFTFYADGEAFVALGECEVTV